MLFYSRIKSNFTLYHKVCSKYFFQFKSNTESKHRFDGTWLRFSCRVIYRRYSFRRRMVQRIIEQKTQYRKIEFKILPIPQNISLTEKTVFKNEFGMLNKSDAVGGKMSSATSHSQTINRLVYRGEVTAFTL